MTDQEINDLKIVIPQFVKNCCMNTKEDICDGETPQSRRIRNALKSYIQQHYKKEFKGVSNKQEIAMEIAVASLSKIIDSLPVKIKAYIKDSLFKEPHEEIKDETWSELFPSVNIDFLQGMDGYKSTTNDREFIAYWKKKNLDDKTIEMLRTIIKSAEDYVFTMSAKTMVFIFNFASQFDDVSEQFILGNIGGISDLKSFIEYMLMTSILDFNYERLIKKKISNNK